MKQLRIGLAVVCAAAVLAAAADGGSADAAASAGAYQPAVGIADAEYSVPFYGRLWSNHTYDRVFLPQAAATHSANYFAQVAVTERDGSDLDLSFAVEGQSDASGYQTCHPDEGCTDVTVRATPDGLLYLHTERYKAVYYTHLGGFAGRAVELSVADADSGLKVYREAAVEPPPEAAGCEDYGDDTPEAFTCLFLRQLAPAGQAASADEEYLRKRLPRLVQDSSNYRLVFAEEFNGTPPAADADGCKDGLSTLDAAVWNYFDACSNVDSRGEPCGNVGSGGYTMAATGTCKPGVTGPFVSASIDTAGLLHMKYGYLEAKYTFNIDQWSGVYHNYTMLLNLRGPKLHELRDKYGVEIENWEDHLKHSGVEVDIFELPGNFDVAHQYANWAVKDKPDTLKPLKSTKWTDYCRYDGGQGVVRNLFRPKNRCNSTDTFTVTRGIEWTPRGYRTYTYMHGLTNGLILVPKEKMYIQQIQDGRTKGVGWPHKDGFFEHLVPGDAGSLLEQVGVAHTPLPLHLNTWSYMVKEQQPYIRRRLTFDYVRVWQPENHYADMEPVYQ